MLKQVEKPDPQTRICSKKDNAAETEAHQGILGWIDSLSGVDHVWRDLQVEKAAGWASRLSTTCGGNVTRTVRLTAVPRFSRHRPEST